MVNKIVNNDFQAVKASKLAVVDFSAVWCGPCQMLAPVLEELSDEMAGEADFFNADSDANMELVREYRVTNIPALFIFKNGEKVAQQVGFLPKENLKKWIEENK
ncbi:thioredoxin [Roseburia sp. MUC/MUC-530-WT-4D]|uniref:Thioredoxin n=1 Tax=Roseburia porci TaxID=2605790 RepID=A0A6L5YQE8_9FIRM|nr:thioredoxin [Roseburia porci]MCI5516763.1 thioredoxin [Roseburia sp.]MDD6744095.1 thioredoxin [Roseburia porci]MST74169.1 thioredoxin [Roseburia porci]